MRSLEAIEDFDKAISLDPTFTWALWWRAQKKSELNQDQEAIQDCLLAIEVWEFDNAKDKPGLDSFYIYLSEYQKKIGQFNEAIVALNQAIAINSSEEKYFKSAYALRGEALDALGRHKEAIQDYDRAIKVKPTRDRFILRAKSKMNLGEFAEAFKDCDQAFTCVEADIKKYGSDYSRDLINRDLAEITY